MKINPLIDQLLYFLPNVFHTILWCNFVDVVAEKILLTPMTYKSSSIYLVSVYKQMIVNSLLNESIKQANALFN